jgi:2-desacetyl-2-hydroxyethyl bacteriochlorophyllide A dehydrogenase
MPDIQARIVAAHDLRLDPCPRPTPGPGQIALRTLRTLLSPGTELAFWSGTHAALADPAVPWAKYPFLPGYAAVGEVVAVGDGVSGWRIGDRAFWSGRHAAWALASPSHESVLPVPDGMDPAHTPFCRLAQIARLAVLRARRVPRRCLVLGAGPIGLLAAQQLRIGGAARVLVADLSAPRLARARACGLQTLAAGAAPAEARHELGGDPELVVEATGVPQLVVEALRAVATGGEVLVLGSPRGAASIDLYQLVHLKNATLTGAHESAMPAQPNPGAANDRGTNMLDALEAISDGRLRVAPMISHMLPPDRLAEAYQGSASDKDAWYGVILDWES